jgi:hypothetical protein
MLPAPALPTAPTLDPVPLQAARSTRSIIPPLPLPRLPQLLTATSGEIARVQHSPLPRAPPVAVTADRVHARDIPPGAASPWPGDSCTADRVHARDIPTGAASPWPGDSCERAAWAAVTADLVPVASTSADAARKLIAEYSSHTRDTPAGAACPWLNPALRLDAPGDYCERAAWAAVHLRRRAALVLLVGAWWLLLAAGAGSSKR